MTTAERLRELMDSRGLKQKDIVDMCQPLCDATGGKIGKSHISQWVRGRNPITRTKSKSLELQRFKALFPCISTVCLHLIVSYATHRVSIKTHFTLQNVIRFVI